MRKKPINHVTLRRAALLIVSVACLLVSLLVPMASTEPKLIALTFDDGPSPEYTPKVLEILDRENVKATFFMVGEWLPGKRALVRQMVQDGQQIGNHTFDHVKLKGLSVAEIQSEISRTDAALADYTGLTDSTFMVRPPYGARNGAMLSAIDAPVILWTLDPAAGKQVPGAKMARFVLSRAKDGDIILLHDTTQYNLDAVEPIIKGLKSKGFTFVTVEELFRSKGVTPQNGVAYKRIVGTGQNRFDELPATKPSGGGSSPQAAASAGAAVSPKTVKTAAASKRHVSSRRSRKHAAKHILPASSTQRGTAA